MHLPCTGCQIILRDWQLADLEPYRRWMQPGQRWQDFDGPYYPPLTPGQVDARVEQLYKDIVALAWPTPRTQAGIADRVSGALLGRVSWYWIGQETNWLAVGIDLFDPAHWGRGYGYEALGLWCDYLWASMPVPVRLDLRTWSGNHGMMALASKLGFQEEARFRKARIVGGHFYDGLGYGVLREEWATRYPQGFAASLAGAPRSAEEE